MRPVLEMEDCRRSIAAIAGYLISGRVVLYQVSIWGA